MWYNYSMIKLEPTVKSMKPAIVVDMLDAIKVQFLKPIFEDDFVERGMTAWLTGIEWSDNTDCYKLFFDFKDFESENDKYFKETYYPNSSTRALLAVKDMYTAKEAGMYTPKLQCYLSVSGDKRDDEKFAEEIKQYLKVL